MKPPCILTHLVRKDAPGGYVNFGRTLPGWDRFCLNKSFGQRPWLFQNFDQLSFYNVEEEEFERIYDRFMAGKYDFDIQDAEFDVDEYSEFCQSVQAETEEFKVKQAEGTRRENERYVSPVLIHLALLSDDNIKSMLT